MKLRNKKTGKIVPACNICVGIGKDGLWFDNLFELNEQFEDYKLPLIEDDEVRKIVKQWLMISLDNHMNIFFDKYMNGFYLYEENSDRSVAGITFPDNIKFNLVHDKNYTIEELCGEEQ